jgi:uncharacterized protein (DUF2062 family)
LSQKNSNRSLWLALAAVTGQVGCITLVLTLGAILLGLWLDGVFGIRPVLTIGFTLLSLPITLYSIFAIVRWTTGRMLNTEQDKAVPEEE